MTSPAAVRGDAYPARCYATYAIATAGRSPGDPRTFPCRKSSNTDLALSPRAPVDRRGVVLARRQLHAVIREPYRLDIVVERLPAAAGIVYQAGADVHLRRLPRALGIGLPRERAGGHLAAAQVVVVGGVARAAV